MGLEPRSLGTESKVDHLVSVEPVRQVSDDLGGGVALVGVPEQVLVEVGHIFKSSEKNGRRHIYRKIISIKNDSQSYR